MRTIIFGGGDAQAEIPPTWLSGVKDNGAVVVYPPDQDTAFLWLSTLSWRNSDRPDFSPAGEYLLEEKSPNARIETHQHAIIAYTLEESEEDGLRLDSHQLRVLPKRAADCSSIVAYLTLSVKHDTAVSQIVLQIIEDTRSVARTVVFNYEAVALYRDRQK